MENFNLKELKSDDLTQKQKITYLCKYFIPLTTGDHAFYEDGKYTIVKHEIITKTWLNRIPAALKQYYTKDLDTIRRVAYELNKPLLFGDKLNLCPPMLHKPKKYDLFSDDVKSKVDMMLQYINDVWCYDDKDGQQFNYLKKWFANMIQGKKNDTALYVVGPKRIGKSTLSEFIRDHVVGRDLSVECGSGPLTSKFNSILAGKLNVTFEEVETFNHSEWSAVNQRIKRMITSDIMMYESKNVNPWQANNINNYIFLSNDDFMKDNDGDRICHIQMSTKYRGDKKYFGNLRKNCFNDEVGHAFYCYLMEIDTSKFIPQNMPINDSKCNAIVKKLDSCYKFLKDQYVLPEKEMKDTLYNIYTSYASTCDKKPYCKNDFVRKLSEIGIEKYRTGKAHKYNMPYKTLHTIAVKFKWLHELDHDVAENEEDDNDNDLDYNPDVYIKQDEHKNKMQQQTDEIAELKLQIKAFQNNTTSKYEKIMEDYKSMTSTPLKKKEKVEDKKDLDEEIELDW